MPCGSTPGAYRGYTSPELDAILAETRVLTDPGRERRRCRRPSRNLLENAIHVPLYTPGRGMGVRRPAGGRGLSRSRPSSIRSSAT